MQDPIVGYLGECRPGKDIRVKIFYSNVSSERFAGGFWIWDAAQGKHVQTRINDIQGKLGFEDGIAYCQKLEVVEIDMFELIAKVPE